MPPVHIMSSAPSFIKSKIADLILSKSSGSIFCPNTSQSYSAAFSLITGPKASFILP
ncbi:hypothetical protein D3C81_647370 [compost metagenome]